MTEINKEDICNPNRKCRKTPDSSCERNAFAMPSVAARLRYQAKSRCHQPHDSRANKRCTENGKPQKNDIRSSHGLMALQVEELFPKNTTNGYMPKTVRRLLDKNLHR